MKLSSNHWDNTEDDDTFEEQPAISFKALAWGAGLTILIMLLLLKLWTLFQR